MPADASEPRAPSGSDPKQRRPLSGPLWQPGPAAGAPNQRRCQVCAATEDLNRGAGRCLDQTACKQRRLLALAATATAVPSRPATGPYCHVCGTPAVVALSQHVSRAWVCRPHQSQ